MRTGARGKEAHPAQRWASLAQHSSTHAARTALVHTCRVHDRMGHVACARSKISKMEFRQGMRDLSLMGNGKEDGKANAKEVDALHAELDGDGSA